VDFYRIGGSRVGRRCDVGSARRGFGKATGDFVVVAGLVGIFRGHEIRSVRAYEEGLGVVSGSRTVDDLSFLFSDPFLTDFLSGFFSRMMRLRQ
jgi:hypothetical protein